MQTEHIFIIERVIFIGITVLIRRQLAIKSFQYQPTVSKAAVRLSLTPLILYAIFLIKSFKDARLYREELGFSLANLFSKGLERDKIQPLQYANYNLLVLQLYLSKISFLYLQLKTLLNFSAIYTLPTLVRALCPYYGKELARVLLSRHFTEKRTRQAETKVKERKRNIKTSLQERTGELQNSR